MYDSSRIVFIPMPLSILYTVFMGEDEYVAYLLTLHSTNSKPFRDSLVETFRKLGSAGEVDEDLR